MINWEIDKHYSEASDHEMGRRAAFWEAEERKEFLDEAIRDLENAIFHIKALAPSNTEFSPHRLISLEDALKTLEGWREDL